MARAFVVASDEYLVYSGTPPASAEPLTLAAWFYPTTDSHNAILSINEFGASSQVGWGIVIDGSDAGDPATAFAAQETWVYGVAKSTTGGTLNTWNHVCGVFTNSASRAVFLDGGGKGTDTTSIPNTSGTDRTLIATEAYSSSISGGLDGRVAEAAIWNVALADAEVAALAAGYSPLFIRPQNLVFYCPVWGNDSPEIDEIGRLQMTLNGTPTKVDHPPIIYPSTIQIPPEIQAATGQQVFYPIRR